jgi:hypothetical protein
MMMCMIFSSLYLSSGADPKATAAPSSAISKIFAFMVFTCYSFHLYEIFYMVLRYCYDYIKNEDPFCNVCEFLVYPYTRVTDDLLRKSSLIYHIRIVYQHCIGYRYLRAIVYT